MLELSACCSALDNVWLRALVGTHLLLWSRVEEGNRINIERRRKFVAGRKWEDDEVGRGRQRGGERNRGGKGKEISVSACTASQNRLCPIAHKCVSVGTMGKASQQAPRNTEPTLRTPPNCANIFPHVTEKCSPRRESQRPSCGGGKRNTIKSAWEFGLAPGLAEFEPPWTTRQCANSPTPPCVSQFSVRLPSRSHNSVPTPEQSLV